MSQAIQVPVIKVSSKSMPAVGLGLWKIDQDSAADAVYEAIKVGYRHLDSAADYGNEQQVGEGIARAIADGLCSREELWVTVMWILIIAIRRSGSMIPAQRTRVWSLIRFP